MKYRYFSGFLAKTALGRFPQRENFVEIDWNWHLLPNRPFALQGRTLTAFMPRMSVFSCAPVGNEKFKVLLHFDLP